MSARQIHSMIFDGIQTETSLARSIIFEVTARCNERCSHCYNVWRLDDSYPKGELDTAGAERLLDKIISEARPLNISFTGGEPLLRPDIVRLAAFVVARKVDANVLTNGSLLSEDLAKDLIETGVSLFEIPILALRETHNSMTGLDAFDRTIEAIANVKLHRGRVVTVFVNTKKNLGEIGEMLKLSFALGADGVMVNRFNPGGEGARHIEELLPSIDELYAAFDTVERLASEYKLPISTPIPMPPCIFDASRYKRLKFHSCAAGTDNAYFAVDPLGNVRMCNHTSLILGNALDEPFGRIVSKERTAEFESAAPPGCDGCAHRATCQGGCKASAQVCFGSLRDPEPFLRACPDWPRRGRRE
ncbi:MAG: radical SAM protein [Deltaproteobacteria bacterium]|nr:radical SAM protein [Deltaproteobacteria bacterium]